MTAPVVTVVIVTWNGAHLLPSCLDGLRRQSVGPDAFRTIVVDNASTDATTEVLAAYPWVDVVRAERNLGFAGGATLGLRRVTTPYAAVLNNDAVPCTDWLAELLVGFTPGVVAVTSKVLLEPRFVRLSSRDRIDAAATVAVNGTDLTDRSLLLRSGTELLVPVADGAAADVTIAGPLGPVLLAPADEPGAPSPLVHVRPGTPRVDVINSAGGRLTPTAHGADIGYLEVDEGQYDEDHDVFSVCGAAAAFRTDVGSSAGWFDPWFFAYYEDLDLSWRLRRRGGRIRYVSAAVVRHQHAATSRVGSDVFLFGNYRNRLATAARNATVPELAGFVRASVRARVPVAAAATPLGRTAAPAPRSRVWRLRARALVSFAGHLPVLLLSRFGRGPLR